MPTLQDILQTVPDVTLEGSRRAGDVEVRDVTFDSRAVAPGTLFVALRGTRHDGHAFVGAAVDAGAAAVLVDRAWFEAHGAPLCGDDDGRSLAVLVAPDTRAVLGHLASAFYGRPSERLRVIGITGTNGKTTTSYLVEAILKAAGREPGVVGTINYRWRDRVLAAANTTPESLVVQRLMADMATDGVSDVVMEVSSHGLETHRLVGTRFDVAVFTNLSQDHLDFHGTMEAYGAAKRRLFLELLPASARAGKRAVAVVNLDDAEGKALAARVAERHDVELVTFSVARPDATIHCRRVEAHIDGSVLEIESPAGRGTVRTAMLGDFNVSNCLAALGAALGAGVGFDDALRGLATVTGVPGRLERVDAARRPAVFVDYAHTPDALERALATLRPLVAGRLVVVFGCGGDRDRGKRAVMGEVAARGADVVVVTSDNPRTEEPVAIIDDILVGARRHAVREVAALGTASGAEDFATGAVLWSHPERRGAIRAAIAAAGAEDVVLVAGKGHENYQEVHGTRHPFDDVREARAALDLR